MATAGSIYRYSNLQYVSYSQVVHRSLRGGEAGTPHLLV